MAQFHPVETTGRLYRDVYVIGDVHGSLDGLQAILEHAELLNPDGRWSGRRAQMVQCGDIVDRGPNSQECLDLLLKLRREARRAGGSVDLLVGNHELAIAQGDYSISDLPKPEAVGKQLAKLIRMGRLQAARAYRQYLMTHAGVSTELMRFLITELHRKSQRRITVAALARHLKQELKAAFLKDDFSHPMFHVGPARGGSHSRGGVFWADLDFDHDTVTRHPEIWQIFGHTPPSNGSAPFRVSPDARRINIDVGICGRYGSYRAYVKVLPDRIVGIHCDETQFEEEILAAIEEPVTA